MIQIRKTGSTADEKRRATPVKIAEPNGMVVGSKQQRRGLNLPTGEETFMLFPSPSRWLIIIFVG